MEQKMFCYQCQETAGCRGCTMVGVCGKQPDVAAMQDLLVYVSRGISAVTTALRKEGKTVAPEINHLITLNLFTTITNANFDRESIEARIRATLEAKAQLLAQLGDTANLPQAALWDGAGDWEEKARTVVVGLTLYQLEISIPFEIVSAASVITIIPLFVIVLLFQKNILGGLLDGGIKE